MCVVLCLKLFFFFFKKEWKDAYSNSSRAENLTKLKQNILKMAKEEADKTLDKRQYWQLLNSLTVTKRNDVRPPTKSK